MSEFETSSSSETGGSYETPETVEAEPTPEVSEDYDAAATEAATEAAPEVPEDYDAAEPVADETADETVEDVENYDEVDTEAADTETTETDDEAPEDYDTVAASAETGDETTETTEDTEDYDSVVTEGGAETEEATDDTEDPSVYDEVAETEDETTESEDEETSETEDETTESEDEETSETEDETAESEDEETSETEDEPTESEDEEASETEDETTETEDEEASETEDETTESEAEEATETEDEETSETEDETTESEDEETSETEDETTESENEETSETEDETTESEDEETSETEDETTESEDEETSETEDETTESEEDEDPEDKTDESGEDEDPEDETSETEEGTEREETDAIDPNKSAYEQMLEYMSSHNYGKEDAAEYMQDPKWQALNNAMLVEMGREPIDYGSTGWQDTHIENTQKDLEAAGLQPDSPEMAAILQNEQAALDAQRNAEAAEAAKKEAEEKEKEAKEAAEAEIASKLSLGWLSRFTKPETPKESEPTKETEPEGTVAKETEEKAEKEESAEVEELSLKERFDKLKGKKIEDLTEDEKKELINIAVDNLQEKCGNAIPAERFEKIRQSISFEDGNDLYAQGRLEKNEIPYVLGFYSSARDDIVINTTADNLVDTVLTTLDHEALHMATQNDTLKVTGVKTNKEGLQYRNVGMNEGLTEMYSIRNVSNLNPGYVSNSYTKNVAIMSQFEQVFGEQNLRDAYLKNDYDAIKADYEKYMGTGSFYRFCATMDAMHRCYENNGPGYGPNFYNSLEAWIKQYARKKGAAKA